ncbi:MAG: hypothetical protein II942_03240 [Alphaproteobacteria bacterium]|nr:hypothetical protein [Alphaproteobacteria bacterium]
MAEKSIFEQIKKQNGEHFAKAIRAYDSGIFDVPGIVDIVKYAGREAEPIIPYLESLKDIQIEAQTVCKDPITLLSEAGYDAYYADTLEKQNAIQRYFAPGEELCTFRDPERFQHYYIINAIRKDVDKIKREDFRGKERREDKYGTSVISIQILKNGGFISIKNRYNHTVQNPDNTFNSNPDRIIRGLADSIRHHFHVDFSSRAAALPNNYILLNCHQVVRYNLEANNVYFGDGFYVKDGDLHPIDTDKEILMDQFLFNMKDKTIIDVADEHIRGGFGEIDCFLRVFPKEIKGKNVHITKDKNGYHLFADKEEILTIKDGRITAVNLPTTQKIGDNFLFRADEISSFTAPQLKEVKDGFLGHTPKLLYLRLPSLQKTGKAFLIDASYLRVLSVPRLTTIEPFFLKRVSWLGLLDAPKLRWNRTTLNPIPLSKFFNDRTSWKAISQESECFHIPVCMFATNAPLFSRFLPANMILPKDFSVEQYIEQLPNGIESLRNIITRPQNTPQQPQPTPAPARPNRVTKPAAKKLAVKIRQRQSSR